MRARELRHASTDAERAIWAALRDRRMAGFKFRRQHPVGPHFADFACVEARLIVELDGGQHHTDEGLRADEQRTQALEAAGYTVIRFSDRDVLLQRDAVLSAIHDRLASSHPHPCPLPPAGEGEIPKERA